MPFTWKDIFLKAEKHAIDGAMQTYLKVGKYYVSIVGGSVHTYGNFFDDFEVAIFNKKHYFVTNKFVPNIGSNSVAKNKTLEEVIELLNSVENAK